MPIEAGSYVGRFPRAAGMEQTAGRHRVRVPEGNGCAERFGCVFEGPIVALGSGKMSADPFLRFLTDVFCGGVQPKVRDAVFLAAWTVQHAIDTTPGGVAGPIRVATFEPDLLGTSAASSLRQTLTSIPPLPTHRFGRRFIQCRGCTSTFRSQPTATHRTKCQATWLPRCSRPIGRSGTPPRSQMIYPSFALAFERGQVIAICSSERSRRHVVRAERSGSCKRE